jgi:hypothetical protein
VRETPAALEKCDARADRIKESVNELSRWRALGIGGDDDAIERKSAVGLYLN